MDLIRHGVDISYDLTKPLLFYLTKKDPQIAHDRFIDFSIFIHNFGLEKFLLDNNSNYKESDIKISNAAGLNKYGDIPPTTFHYLGFDRVVIGSVTNDENIGHDRPNIERLVKSKSLRNWQELPGLGSYQVAENLRRFGYHHVPITINVLPTPNTKGKDKLKDLEATVINTRDISFLDRYELNYSCPNDQKLTIYELRDMLNILNKNIYPHQKIYLKVSPGSNDSEVSEIIEAVLDFNIEGFVTTNSSKKGISGDLVYEESLKTQIMYNNVINELGKDWKIIACGGISTIEKLNERIKFGANEIQIYTPLIFEGPMLLRLFRNYLSEIYKE